MPKHRPAEDHSTESRANQNDRRCQCRSEEPAAGEDFPDETCKAHGDDRSENGPHRAVSSHIPMLPRRVEMRASQGPSEEPTGAYVVLYVRIGDDRERSQATHIGAASCFHHPPAYQCQLLELFEDQFFQKKSNYPDDSNAG